MFKYRHMHTTAAAVIQMHICCSEETHPFHCIAIHYKLQMSKEDRLSKEK